MADDFFPVTLTFLGTGDALGVPRVYCDCVVCAEARATGVNRRLRSSALLDTPAGALLIDCGPDWRTQMEGRGLRRIEYALLTHAHFDHIGGLPEWADACRWLQRRGRAYAPASVLGTIRRSYPWLESQLDYTAVDEGLSFGGWSIAPWLVNHGQNGHSFAYRFDNGRFRWAYCPDAIDLTPEQKAPLQGLDLLVLGTSYYKEEAPMHTRSVYDMSEALELIAEVSPRRTLFTHMSHGVDLAAGHPLPDHAQPAVAGLQVRLDR